MSDETVTTQDYVRAAIAGDALKAQELFSQLMAPKIVDAVDQKRTEIARSYFGEQPPEVVIDNPDQPEIEDSAAVQNAQNDEQPDDAQEQEQEEESNENA